MSSMKLTSKTSTPINVILIMKNVTGVVFNIELTKILYHIAHIIVINVTYAEKNNIKEYKKHIKTYIKKIELVCRKCSM